MKKLIILLFLIALPLIMSAQYYVTTYGTITTGVADTTEYLFMGTAFPCVVAFNYKYLDNVDAVLELANISNPDSLTFDPIDDNNFPYIMTDSTLTVVFVDGFPDTYLGVKVTNNSVSSGLPIYWTKIIYK